MKEILSAESRGLPKLIASGESSTNLDYMIMIRYGDTLKSLFEEMGPFSCKTVIQIGI